MKERRKVVPALTAAPIAPETPRTGPTAESLSEVDKGLVDNTKLKRELALSNVKNALAQSENAELLYNNVILQLALKYGLTEGDVITEDGIIQRSKQGK